MAPKVRGRKKAEVVEEVNEAVADKVIKAKKVGKVAKAPKKGVNSDVENRVNGSGDPQETEEQIETASGSDVPTDENPSKRRQRPAKTKGQKELADEGKEEPTKVEEETKPKDLPAKRGRKPAKAQNGTDSTKDEESHEAKADVEVGGLLPRSRRKGKADVEPSNSVKEQKEPEPKETKAKSTRRGKVPIKEESVEKEVPVKAPGRKKRNAVEQTESEAAKKVKDEKHEIDESRHLRVALKRNETLDEMARQQMEDDAEVAEEPKVKNVKGPAKSKGKRAANDDAKDSQPIKKTKEDTSKSKGAAKKEKDKIPDVTALDFGNESKTTDGKPWNLKIATWNVNGVRAWLEKNGMSYLHHEKPDIMCIQETKCSEDKLPPEVSNVDGYHCYWLAGDKDGYSGVGLMSKEKPISVQYGINMEKHDSEGRVITAEYEEFYLVNTYIPNSGRGLVRLDYRQDWDKDFRSYLKKLDEKKPVVLCGDLNVAHEEIDLKNPKSNKKTAGFTKEEREGFSTLLGEGFIDTFRHLYPDQTDAYTFWTYMMNARAKNVGWRLDYFVISKRFVDHLCDSVIRKDVYGSDHCPISLFLHV